MSPTVLRQEGYRFFFFSREDHEPPHVHVEKEEGYGKLWLDPVEFARVRGFNPGEERRILEIVTDHRVELLEAWHEHLG